MHAVKADENYQDTLTMYKRMIRVVNTLNWFFGHDIYSPNFKIGPYTVLIECLIIGEFVSSTYVMVENLIDRDYVQALQAISTVGLPLQASRSQIYTSLILPSNTL